MFRLHLETVRVRDDRHAHPHVHAADGIFVCVKPPSPHNTHHYRRAPPRARGAWRISLMTDIIAIPGHIKLASGENRS